MPAILYSTLAKGPKLPFEYQLNSTRHFMRDLNRLCVTSVIDAGGGYQNYPEDYEVIDRLHKDGQLTLRIAYNLFTQKPKEEKEDFLRWTSQSKYQQGDDYFRLNGAGEMLVYSAADFEDFKVERPDMPPEMEGELESVVRILAQNRWPWRLHATYDETISRSLDVFEKVNAEIPLEACTGSSTMPRRSATSRSTASPSSAAASPSSTGWPIRANISSSATAERRRTHAADQAHHGCGREDLGRHRCHPRRVLRPLGLDRVARHRQDPGRLAALSGTQLPGPRDGAADVDGEHDVVLQRGEQERQHQGRAARRSGRPRPRLLRGSQPTTSGTCNPS